MLKNLSLITLISAAAITVTSCGQSQKNTSDGEIPAVPESTAQDSANAQAQAVADSLKKAAAEDSIIANAFPSASIVTENINDGNFGIKGKILAARPANEIKKALEAKGYTGKLNSRRVYDDASEENITLYSYKGSVDTPQGTISVTSSDISELTIKFPTAEMKDRFIDEAKALGYKSNGANSFIDPSFSKGCYWGGSNIKVKGNTVIISNRYGN